MPALRTLKSRQFISSPITSSRVAKLLALSYTEPRSDRTVAKVSKEFDSVSRAARHRRHALWGLSRLNGDIVRRYISRHSREVVFVL